MWNEKESPRSFQTKKMGSTFSYPTTNPILQVLKKDALLLLCIDAFFVIRIISSKYSYKNNIILSKMLHAIIIILYISFRDVLLSSGGQKLTFG